jgi:sugar phosphate isomerase/epimerase
MSFPTLDSKHSLKNMNRRSFITSGTLAAAAATLPASSAKAAPSSKKPLFKISLAQWSLHKRLFKREGTVPLDHLDFARTARSFGIDGLEYVNAFFFDKAKDADYLREMNNRAESEGVKNLLIMVDREGMIGNPDNAERTKTVENHQKWLEAAATLGCHSIRVNAGSKGTFEEQQKLAADGLHRLCEAGDKVGINVIVENHGGLSSNGKWLSGVMKMVDHKRCGTLPDFGNFLINRETQEWYDIYKGMKDLMPYAKAVSAKAYDWAVHPDPNVCVVQRPNQKREVDFKKMLKIVLKNGYNGYIGIEYEGGYQDEMQGIAMTKGVLDRLKVELS